MQLFCAAACFLFASGTPLQATELAFGSDSRACYAAFLCSLTETFRGLNSCICALTSFSEGSCSALLPFRSLIVLSVRRERAFQSPWFEAGPRVRRRRGWRRRFRSL